MLHLLGGKKKAKRSFPYRPVASWFAERLGTPMSRVSAHQSSRRSACGRGTLLPNIFALERGETFSDHRSFLDGPFFRVSRKINIIASSS